MSSDTTLIHWEGLSQSLQERFYDIEESIKSNTAKIADNKKIIDNDQILIDMMDDKISELEKRITNKFNLIHNKIKNIKITGGKGNLSRYFIEQSELGDIARIDTDRRKIYGSKILELKLVYTTDTEKQLILSQNIEDLYNSYEIEMSMYNLSTGDRLVYSIDDSEWLDVGGYIDDWLPKYTFLLNPITHKLYFYECNDKWTDLSTLCDTNTGNVYRW